MEYSSLIIRIILMYVFLSTSLSKLNKMDQHILTVKEYNLLPNRFVRFFSILEVYFELSVGLFLLLGLFPGITSGIAVVLLLIFTSAISINLLRGRNNISCGCGGIAGNHQISWILVFRNLLLGFMAVYLYMNPSNTLSINSVIWGQSFSDVFSIDSQCVAIITVALILTFQILKNLGELKKRCEALLKDA